MLRSFKIFFIAGLHTKNMQAFLASIFSVRNSLHFILFDLTPTNVTVTKLVKACLFITFKTECMISHVKHQQL